jgi:hypothetical protein
MTVKMKSSNNYVALLKREALFTLLSEVKKVV